jgi:putative spermidine/putrescine transport system permease protein
MKRRAVLACLATPAIAQPWRPERPIEILVGFAPGGGTDLDARSYGAAMERVLGVPFVVITMTATLSGFDRNLVKAASSLGADPFTTFTRVTLPLVAPGMISGALFAFAASFDEVVTVLFLGGPEQRTIPRQMWSGIREQISPTILAVATLLILFSSLLLLAVEMLRRWHTPPSGPK